jgi:hypothetical protein
LFFQIASDLLETDIPVGRVEASRRLTRPFAAFAGFGNARPAKFSSKLSLAAIMIWLRDLL